jgi:D-3-phosphoglycerate dehydrogenase
VDPALNRADRLPPGVTLVDLSTLLFRADVVSIHAASPAADGPLIGAAEIATMKPGARIVNTSRGYLLDEAALCEGLRTGRLSGAALDVFADEPYSGPLLSFPQVLCTPHIGTLTRASRIAMELKAVENVIRFLKH